MFKQEVSRYIEEKSLFKPNEKILVALSGGADSVALLRVLLALGYTCECAHCNFHLRGEESERDELFVRQLCETLSVKLHITHFDTKTYAKNKHISIEMAARDLRYTWFESLRMECNASVIAVAHHQDDSVETLLLNLIRGTGIQGLKGISPRNGYIVRPLLQVSRTDILNYLYVLHQDYVTDSSNLQDEFKRNKIRLNVIPILQELNPSVCDSIADTADRLAEVAFIYQKEIERGMQRVVSKKEGNIEISIHALQNEVSPSSLLFEILHPYGFNSSQIKDIYRSITTQSGKCIQNSDWRVLRNRETLILQAVNQEEISVPKLTYEVIEITPDFLIPTDCSIACLDADKVIFPLSIRKWEIGDKFMPLGMNGKKKISDYLTDKKFSLYQKEKQFVVCSGNEIVWLVNERIDNRYRIHSQSKRALLLRVAD